MAGEISDETRYEVVRQYILHGDSKDIGLNLHISESSVRNILKEYKAGKYPEYAQFIPHVEAIRRLGMELEGKGLSVAKAIVGAVVFSALIELEIDPVQLQTIMSRLQGFIGSIPPAEFGRAVQQLVQLASETGLSFHDLELLIGNKRAELEDVLAKVKTANDERTEAEKRKTEAQGSLEQTLKQNAATRAILDTFLNFKRSWKEAGLSEDSMESNFQTFIDFTRIARDQGYLEAAKELQRRKRETGMSFEQILREYDEIRASNQKSREEKIQLSGEVQRLKDHIAELKREEEAQYSQNNVSKEQVQKYLRIGDQLKRGGIDLEQQD